MRKQSLTIPGTLPDLNAVLTAAKRHWSRYARQKKHFTHTVALLARTNRLQKVKNPVAIRFIWITKDQRKDPDNLAAGGTKVVLDGLVEAGILPDDSRRWIHKLTHQFPEPDRKNPRTIIELEELSSQKV